MRTNIKTYSELMSFKTYKERLDYLKLDGKVGLETFGCDRYLNQAVYRSSRWKKLRNDIIIRDNGCDLAVENYIIYGRVIIHHMNPIQIVDIKDENEDILFNPDYLICTTIDTHNAIHYGNDNEPIIEYVERRPNDTCPWKK